MQLSRILIYRLTKIKINRKESQLITNEMSSSASSSTVQQTETAPNPQKQGLVIEVQQKPSLMQNQQIPNQPIPDSESLVGPFLQQSVQKVRLKQVDDLNCNNQEEGDNAKNFSINPIVNEAPPTQRKKRPKVKNYKNNKLTEETEQQHNEQEDLEREILSLARNIRTKVKKQNPAFQFSGRPLYGRASPMLSPLGMRKYEKGATIHSSLDASHLKGVSVKQNKEKISKRHSLFTKYSYPYTNQSKLISKDDKSLLQVSQRSEGDQISNSLKENSQVDGVEQEYFRQRNQQQTENSVENSQQSSPKETTDKKSTKLPKIKFNFDKKHYKYEVTEFRKSILLEKKERALVKEELEQRKIYTLQKRKELFENSRYNPVGIKLSDIRASKLQKGLRKSKLLSGNSIFQNSVSEKTKEKGKDQQLKKSPLETPFKSTQQHFFEHDNTKTISEIKVVHNQGSQSPYKELSLFPNESNLQQQSVNFNLSEDSTLFQHHGGSDFPMRKISLHDQPPAKIKSNSELFNDLDSLTKDFENDSTPQERLEKKRAQEEEERQKIPEGSNMKTNEMELSSERQKNGGKEEEAEKSVERQVVKWKASQADISGADQKLTESKDLGQQHHSDSYSDGGSQSQEWNM